MTDFMKCHVVKDDDYSSSTSFYMYYDGDPKRIIQCQQALIVKEEGQYYQPSLQLDTMAAKAVFQAMWEAGFRPNSGESSVAHVEALKNHISDLRRLVFKGEE